MLGGLSTNVSNAGSQEPNTIKRESDTAKQESNTKSFQNLQPTDLSPTGSRPYDPIRDV